MVSLFLEFIDLSIDEKQGSSYGGIYQCGPQKIDHGLCLCLDAACIPYYRSSKNSS